LEIWEKVVMSVDAELLLLGARLLKEEADALRAQAVFSEMHEQILDKVESVATWPANQDRWTRKDSEAYGNALKRFSDAAGESYWAASRAADRAWARHDTTAIAIRNSQPHTVEGLGIKALVPPPDDDQRCVLQ
jgi:hypothetical protein